MPRTPAKHHFMKGKAGGPCTFSVEGKNGRGRHATRKAARPMRHIPNYLSSRDRERSERWSRQSQREEM